MCRQIIEPCGAKPRDEVLTQTVATFNETVVANLSGTVSTVDDGGASDVTSAALFQSLEDLKFLIQAEPPREEREHLARRKRNDIEEMLVVLEHVGRDLPHPVRLRILASIGQELGFSAIGIILQEMAVSGRSGAFADPSALEILISDTFRRASPSSRTSNHFLHFAHQEVTEWTERRRRAGNDRARKLASQQLTIDGQDESD
jgi:hypothetical protein